MDKFGIFNLLSSLSKFYQENKAETDGTSTATSDENAQFERGNNSPFNFGVAEKTATEQGERGGARTELGERGGARTELAERGGARTEQKKKADEISYNSPPSVYISKKMLETLSSHDEFVRRVQEKNLRKPRR